MIMIIPIVLSWFLYLAYKVNTDRLVYIIKLIKNVKLITLWLDINCNDKCEYNIITSTVFLWLREPDDNAGYPSLEFDEKNGDDESWFRVRFPSTFL